MPSLVVGLLSRFRFTPGCLRTFTGAQHFAAIRSYTGTAGKQNINLY